MRLPCPFCGERDAAEFTYRGDASPRRPAFEADEAIWFDYVYLRENPAGAIRELWYHRGGCQSWLVVDRDTRTHAVSGAAAVSK